MNRVVLHCVVMLLLLMLTTAAPRAMAADAGQPGASESRDTPVDVAKDYAEKMKSAKPAEAIRAHWDMDAMLSGIFGEHLRRNNDTEREEIRRLMLQLVQTIYANPRIVQAIKQASFEEYTVSEDKAKDTAVVSFKVHFENTVIPNALRMKRIEGTWKIIDAGSNGRMMVPSLREQYARDTRQMTPLQYVRAMVSAQGGKEKE